MSEWVKAAELSRCPPGNHLGVQISGEAIVIANVDGDLYALRDVCSHQDFPLSDGEVEGTQIECIYHGATFDVCTGKATGLPAIAPVKTYEVEVRDGDIYVQI
jgi:3-phenylpropionate/trans-cinnamate dioxygenase ferredoxin component